MPTTATDFAHVRLTVTDIGASRAFYDDVFGFDVAFEVPAAADAATRDRLSFLFGGVIYSFGGGMFGLRRVAPHGDRFDPDRVGLDHVSFAVADRSEIDSAAAHLDERGIAHGGVKNIGAGFILEFRDPDGNALELFAPAS